MKYIRYKILSVPLFIFLINYGYCSAETENFSDIVYYRVNNANETHNNFVYKDGWNYHHGQIEKSPELLGPGLYFTNKKNLAKYICYGVYVREVYIPKENTDPTFEIIPDIYGEQFRANKIFLGKKYSLFEPETYKILEIEPKLHFFDLMNKLIDENKYDILDNFLKSDIGSQSDLLDHIICKLAKSSTIESLLILEQWKYNIQIKNIEKYVNLAIKNANIIMLKWLNKNYKIKFSTQQLLSASYNNYQDILDFVKTNIVDFDNEKYIDICNNLYDKNIVIWLITNRRCFNSYKYLQKLEKNHEVVKKCNFPDGYKKLESQGYFNDCFHCHSLWPLWVKIVNLYTLWMKF